MFEIYYCYFWLLVKSSTKTEREGFEPPVNKSLHSSSNATPWTTRPSLLYLYSYIYIMIITPQLNKLRVIHIESIVGIVLFVGMLYYYIQWNLIWFKYKYFLLTPVKKGAFFLINSNLFLCYFVLCYFVWYNSFLAWDHFLARGN